MPLGQCGVVGTDGILLFDRLALLSVLVHVGEARPGCVWNALSDALDRLADAAAAVSCARF